MFLYKHFEKLKRKKYVFLKNLFAYKKIGFYIRKKISS